MIQSFHVSGGLWVNALRKTLLMVVMALCAEVGAGAAAQPTEQPADPATDRIIVLRSDQPVLDISTRLLMAEDPTGTTPLGEMQKATFAPLSTKLKLASSETVYWLQLTLDARATGEWFLDVNPPWLDDITLYSPDSQGGFTAKQTGDLFPFSSRDTTYGTFAFLLTPGTGEKTYYLRVRSSGTVWIRATLQRPADFVKSATNHAHNQGVTLGALVLLMLLAAMQGIAFNDRLYIVFVAYVGVTIVLVASGTGFLARYVLPDWPALADPLAPVGGCLSITIYAVFCRYFLFDGSQGRWLMWVFYTLAVIGLTGAVLVSFQSSRWMLPFFVTIKIVGAAVPAITFAKRLLGGSWSDRMLWLGIVANLPAQGILLAGLVAGRQHTEWLSLPGFVTAMLLHLALISFALIEHARHLNEKKQTLQSALDAQVTQGQTTLRLAQDQRSFLSMVAHELRGPLATARSAMYNLELMVKSAAAPPLPQLKRIERVETSLMQMAALIDVCLMHEQRASTQALSMHQRLSVNDVIVHARSGGYTSSSMAPRIRWPAHLPSADMHFDGNVALLAIALKNLIENACRYDTTGDTVEVTLVSRPATPHNGPATVSMAVLDRGPGLEPSQVAHLFEPFIRGPGSTQVEDAADPLPQGLGLGLYIVQRIADMHGAQVRWAAREGGGSVFTLTLVSDEEK